MGADGMLDFTLRLLPLIADTDVYVSGAHIVCFPGKASFIAAWFIDPEAGFCFFLQGDWNSTAQIQYPDGHSIPAISGAKFKQLVIALWQHGCNSCSSIPLDPGNDPHRLGILTLNFVHDRRGCADEVTLINLCDPTFPANDRRNPYQQWEAYGKARGSGDLNEGGVSIINSTIPPFTNSSSNLSSSAQQDGGEGAETVSGGEEAIPFCDGNATLHEGQTCKKASSTGGVGGEGQGVVTVTYGLPAEIISAPPGKESCLPSTGLGCRPGP